MPSPCVHCSTFPRLEAELEEKRLHERKQLMQEIQAMKEAAQAELDRQKGEYEGRLLELETQMVRMGVCVGVCCV